MLYARVKRWVKRRFGKDSLVWKALTPLAAVINLPKTVYRNIRKDSTFRFESEMDMCSLFPESLLDFTLARFRPESVLDLGCGVGRSLDYFLEHGVDAIGVENSPLAIRHARNADHIVQANLNDPVDLGRRFDLVWSYEVVEHIHPQFVDNLMETFSKHADRVVLSAARPGQGGQGHFNEQPPAYWIEKFEGRGYRYDAESASLLHDQPEEFAENMLVFVRDPRKPTT
ncbi:MAG: class I SAM-dependent methyltransferase [Gemmatimonadota bacterium]|jgi:SAM-dependent methyltransferase